MDSDQRKPAKKNGGAQNPAAIPGQDRQRLNDLNSSLSPDELLQALHAMEAIMQNASVAICITRDRRIARYNAKFGEIFGFEGDCGVGLPGRVVYRSDDEYDTLGRSAGPLLALGKPFQTELFLRHRDGSDLWVNLICYVQNPEDSQAGTIWILEDRTEHKRIEQTLESTRDELSAIFQNASIGILFTRDRIIQRCNQRGAEILGYSNPEQLIGKHAVTTYPDQQSYQRIGDEAGPLLGAGLSFHADCLLRKVDGSPVWCNLYAKAVDPAHTDAGTVWIVEDITEPKQIEQAFRRNQRVLENTFEYMDQGISIVDTDLNVLGTNRRFRELLKLPESVCSPNNHFSDSIRYNAERGDYGPGDIEEQVRTRVELARRMEPHHFERERPDGTVLDIRGLPIPGSGFVTIYTDVTKRARAERALRESEANFRSLTELSSDWFWRQDAEFRFTSMEGQHITGDGPNFDAELGKTFWELGFEVKGGNDPHRALLEQHKPFHDVVMRRVFTDGNAHHIRVSGAPMSDANGVFLGYRGVGRDISQEKMAEERIQYLATHDGLTSLPNRVMFNEMLGHAVQTARRYERKLAVLFIDLDRFKLINDTLGHDAGDALLKELASRFTQCLRASDVVARLGGDEFVALIQEINEPDQVAVVARNLLAAAIKPVMFEEKECQVSASIGICMYPAGAQDEKALMTNADSAMYQAKNSGKNNFRFYSRDIQT